MKQSHRHTAGHALWFKENQNQIGWRPIHWIGWVVLAIYIFVVMSTFFILDVGSPSASDTLITFAPHFLIDSVLLFIIVRSTSE